jgi:hypothetical protein
MQLDASCVLQHLIFWLIVNFFFVYYGCMTGIHENVGSRSGHCNLRLFLA